MTIVEKAAKQKEGYGMRALSVVAGVLLIIGGLNWGLVAIAEFDLVAAIFGLSFGETNVASRIVYALVGIAALYKLAEQVAVRRGSEKPVRA